MIAFASRQLRLLYLGVLGEEVMGQALQCLCERGYRIFHDVPGDGNWNVDHVVVGPGGVFAIETKCRMKKPSRNELKEHEAVPNNDVLRFPWCSDRKAMEQGRRNSKWLAQMLSKSTGEKVTTHALIALPGWFVLPHPESDVKVLNGKQVASHIAEYSTTLPPKQIERIAYQLEQRCRDVEF
jgi:hypothetical protein